MKKLNNKYLLLFFLFFSSTFVFSQSNPDIATFYNDFEDNNLSDNTGWGYGLDLRNGGTIAVVSNPDPDSRNNSKYVIRSRTLRSNEGNYCRAEYYTNWGKQFPMQGHKHIIQWDVYFPDNFNVGIDNIWWNWQVITQFVTHPCAKYNGITNFGSNICGGGGIFNEARVISGHNAFDWNYRASPDCHNILWTFPRGRWVTITYEIFWTTSNNGYARLYFDGNLHTELLNIQTLPTGFVPGTCDMRWKVGLYDSWYDSQTTSQEYYIDNMQLYIDEDIETNSGCSINVSGEVVDETDNNSNGSIDIHVIGASEPLFFEWNDGYTSEDRTGLNEGTYEVNITDSEGCETYGKWVVNNESRTLKSNNEPPVIKRKLISPNLYGGSVLEIDASESYDTDGDNLNYSWSIPDGLDASGNSENNVKILLPDVTKKTRYNIYLEVSDGYLSNNDTITIDIEPFPSKENKIKIELVKANNFQEPNIPENIIDGDTYTRWSTEGLNEDLVLSLENPAMISDFGITFYGRESSIAFFDISVSNDSLNWIPVLTGLESCGFSNELHIYNFPVETSQKPFRFVKFIGQGNSYYDWNSVTEINLYGNSLYIENGLSNHKPIIVSNYENSANSGTTKTINATTSFDPDNDPINYSWIIPENINYSSNEKGVITYLAPDVLYPTVNTFVLQVTDGIDTSYKSLDITFVPYKPEVSKIQVAKVTSSYANGNNHPINLFDGDPNTFWTADGDEQWITMEFEAPADISHLKISFHDMEEKKSQFDIFVSNDGETWDTFFEKYQSCGFSNAMHLIDSKNHQKSTSKNYRYLKIVGHGTDLDSENSFSELQLFGDLSTSISSLEEDSKQLKVYPNPASNYFTIEIPEDGYFNLYDLTGKNLFSKYYIKGKYTIEDEFPTGCYIVTVQTENNSKNIIRQKLVIKK